MVYLLQKFLKIILGGWRNTKVFSKITRIKFRDKAISNESPNCLIEGMGHKGEKLL